MSARGETTEAALAVLESEVAHAAVIRGLFQDDAAPRIGRYVLRALLGRGAHGRVFLADDPSLGRTVAIKLLRAEQLHAEASALARVTHPHVVEVYDAGQHHGLAFIAMEFVDGPDLARFIAEHDPDPPTLIRLFAEAASGLTAAHDAGLVHRDFKPSNVLVSAQGQAKVADFGLATDRAGPGAVGTLPYMSPEQRDGRPADARSDQYAFCSALWEAFEGAPPFPVARRMRRAPAWVEPILRRGLSTDPRARFASMAAVRRRLLRRPRPWVPVLATSLGIAVVFATWPASTPQPCDGLTLSTQASDALNAAFVQTAVAGADDLAVRTVEELRAYDDRWSTVQKTACNARPRPETIACLRRGRDAHAALLQALVHAEAPQVRQGPAAVGFLPPPESCTDRLDAAPSLRADEEPSRRALTRARTLQEAHEFEGALASAREAYRLVPAGATHLQARASFRIGRVLQMSEHSAEALEWLEHAYFLARTGAHPEVAANAATQLANITMRVGSDDAANAWLRHAEVELDRAEAPPVIRTAFWVARSTLRAEAGHFDDALQDLDAALEAAEDDGRRAGILGNRGLIHRETGALDEAASDLRRSLELREEICGADCPGAFAATNNLGIVYEARGDLDAARATYEQALTMAIEGWGPESGRVLQVRVNLGQLAFAQGDFSRAAQASRAVREARQRSLGVDHELVFVPTLNLANALLALDRHREAIALYREAIDIVSRERGPQHPHTAYALTGLGAALRHRARYPEAQDVLERAAAIREVVDAPTGLKIETLAELARTYAGQGEQRGAALTRTQATLRRLYDALGPEAAAERDALFAELAGL